MLTISFDRKADAETTKNKLNATSTAKYKVVYDREEKLWRVEEIIKRPKNGFQPDED